MVLGAHHHLSLSARIEMNGPEGNQGGERMVRAGEGKGAGEEECRPLTWLGGAWAEDDWAPQGERGRWDAESWGPTRIKAEDRRSDPPTWTC